MCQVIPLGLGPVDGGPPNPGVYSTACSCSELVSAHATTITSTFQDRVGPVTETLTTFTDTSYQPPDNCCIKCWIDSKEVQIIYWPVDEPTLQNQSANGTVNGNGWNATATVQDSTITAAPTPYSIVQDGFTYVSPSVYVAYRDLQAYAVCPSFGGSYARGKSYNTTIAYRPEELSTSICTTNSAGSMEPAAYGQFAAINYTEYQYSTSAWSVCAKKIEAGSGGSRSIQGPFYSVPRDVSLVDPAWHSCSAVFNGIYDPPHVLSKAPDMVTGVGPSPASPTAAPAHQPAQNMVPPTPTPAPQTPPPSDPPPSDPSVNTPAASNPPPSDPPSNNPPANNSPVNNPPTNDQQTSPAGNSPPNNLPANSPSSDSPATGNQGMACSDCGSGGNPPAGQPPAGQPPAGQPPAGQPPTNNLQNSPQGNNKGQTPSNGQPAPGGGPVAGGASTILVVPQPTSPNNAAPTPAPNPVIMNPPAPAAPITANGFTISPAPASPGAGAGAGAGAGGSPGGAVIAGTTYTAGASTHLPGPNGATPLSVASDHIILGTSSIPLPPAAPPPSPVLLAGNPIRVASNGALVIGTSTLAPAAGATSAYGHAISVGPSSAAIDGTAYALPPAPAPPPTAAITLANGAVVTAGAAPAVVSGTTVALAANGASLLVNGQSFAIPPAAPAAAAAAGAGAGANPVLTVGGQVFTAAPTGFAIGSQTVAPGGAAVTVGGTAVRLGPSGLLVVGASATTLLSAGVGGARETVGGVVVDAPAPAPAPTGTGTGMGGGGGVAFTGAGRRVGVVWWGMVAMGGGLGLGLGW